MDSTWCLAACKERDCLCEIDASVIQRPANDCTGRARGCHGSDVVKRRDAAGGDDVRVDLLDQLAQTRHVGTRERAVASNVGVNEMAHATPRQPLRHLDGPGIRLAQPAVGRQPAIPGVECNRDALTPTFHGAKDQLRLPQSDSAENGTVYAGGKRIFEIAQQPEPAAELDRDVDRGADLRNGLAVDRSPGDGAVEIDDVEPLRTGLHPTAGGQRGIAVIRRLTVEIALDQTHTTAASDVDCRIKDHAGTRTSLSLAIACTPS